MNVLPAYISVRHIHIWFLSRSKEGMGLGITDSSKWLLGIELTASERTASAFNSCAFSLALYACFSPLMGSS